MLRGCAYIYIYIYIYIYEVHKLCVNEYAQLCRDSYARQKSFRIQNIYYIRIIYVYIYENMLCSVYTCVYIYILLYRHISIV